MEDYTGLYRKIYKSLETITPMNFDCGLLCGSKCCKDNGLGMMLFPEEDQYINTIKNNFSIINSDFSVNGIPVKLLTCDGYCKRNTRPIACRIFPLFPYLHKDKITIDFDPRAKGTCPILFNDIEEIYTRGLFRLKILLTAYEMIQYESIKDFLISYTIELDEISRFKF